MLTDTPTNKLKPESHLMSLFQKKKNSFKKKMEQNTSFWSILLIFDQCLQLMD